MSWKPEDLFKKGNGAIITPVDGGFRTRRFIGGRCVGDTLTYQPARAAGVRLTTPVLSINRVLDPADVARVEQWLLGEMADGVDDVSHLNSASLLPPVACPLLIEVDGRLLRAERTGIIASKSDGMEYRLDDGTLIHGRFRWTYP